MHPTLQAAQGLADLRDKGPARVGEVDPAGATIAVVILSALGAAAFVTWQRRNLPRSGPSLFNVELF